MHLDIKIPVMYLVGTGRDIQFFILYGRKGDENHPVWPLLQPNQVWNVTCMTEWPMP